MDVTAKLVGEYAVSPLVFGDQSGGTDILSRLENMPELVSAYIIDDQNQVFASYGADSMLHLSQKQLIAQVTSEKEFSIWSDNLFRINREIVYNGENYGQIYLIISLNPFKQKLIGDLKVLSINMFVIFIISWLLSMFIQQYISKPIKKLVRTTNKIVEVGDYTLRVKNQGNDEIGQLYTSYNKMLDRINQEQQQQKKYSKALELSENNYRSIFENSIVGIFNIDLKTGKLIQANDRFYEILQLKPEKINEYKITQFRSRKDRVKFLQTIKNEGQIENFEIEHKNGIWISISGKKIESQGIIDGVIQDITERKRNFIELKKVNFELDNFVYHASHDLRSPLRSILGLTNLLKYDGLSKSSLNIVNKVESAINRLDRLVTDLLTFSKNSRTNSDKVIIDFDQLIRECIENVPSEYQSDVILNYDISEEAHFYGDRTRISVIINNLLVNSFKYQKAEATDKQINIQIKVSKRFLQFIITDNGEGISVENQEKIFDMFYRASESSEGSGLGLYIVKNVVETLKGNIFMTSDKAEGTSFEIKIPNESNSVSLKN